MEAEIEQIREILEELLQQNEQIYELVYKGFQGAWFVIKMALLVVVAIAIVKMFKRIMWYR